MAEPVDVATARGRLGIVSTHRDVEIGMLISAAREQIEDLSGHILVRRTIFEGLPRLVDQPSLASWPIKALTRLIYTDAHGEEQEIAGASLRLANSTRPARLAPLVGEAWPGDVYSPIVVVDAGYDGDDADPFPPKLIQALLTLVAVWFEDHEGTKPIPQQVLDICTTARAWLV